MPARLARTPAALLALLAVTVSSPVPGADVGLTTGRVVRVVDGDTIWVKPDGGSRKPVKLRLLGIDAPERCQEGGAQATQALASRVEKRTVGVEVRAQDDYRRGLARVWLDGEDINAWMVSQGMAWSTGWRGRPGAYASLEREALLEGRGVRARDGAMAPWEFRRVHGPCD
jgi:endonuclease YncB( thermonuclease family)